MSALYVIDYILLFITALFLFFSIWKGFIQSILGLMTWIGSILITLFFYEELSNYLTNKINQFTFFENIGLSNIIATIISIPIIFIISLIILRKIRKLITSDLDKATLGILLDKFFGIIYGILFSYFVFSITLFFINSLSEDLFRYLIENSLILYEIDLINQEYIYKNIPFIFENAEEKII